MMAMRNPEAQLDSLQAASQIHLAATGVVVYSVAIIPHSSM
jgi:hypothetical protein